MDCIFGDMLVYLEELCIRMSQCTLGILSRVLYLLTVKTLKGTNITISMSLKLIHSQNETSCFDFGIYSDTGNGYMICALLLSSELLSYW